MSISASLASLYYIRAHVFYLASLLCERKEMMLCIVSLRLFEIAILMGREPLTNFTQESVSITGRNQLEI